MLPRLEPRSRRLSNGLRVHVVADAHLPLVAVDIWYHVGSRNDPAHRTGLAHLFEHMLFEGSQHVPGNDHFRHIQSVGGSANGSTWYDRTNYYQTVPREYLERTLWLESDRMGFLLPALSEEKLAVQRSVVLNERRQRTDNQPYGRAVEVVFENLFPAPHPYGWPVIGTTDHIASTTLDEVRDFFTTWYGPGNAVLSIVGDVDEESVDDLVDRWFGDLPPGPAPAAEAPPLPDAAAGTTELGDQVLFERCYLAWQLPPYGSRDWYAADLLATELSAGKSSRLYQDLVHDRQIAQQVAASALPTRWAGSFMAVATAAGGHRAEEVASALRSAVAATAAEQISATAVERARNQLLTSYFDALQSLDHRADLVAQFSTYFDRPDGLADEVAAYMSIQPADLARVAASWLDPAREVCVLVRPGEVA